jgi:hypothetical protein
MKKIHHFGHLGIGFGRPRRTLNASALPNTRKIVTYRKGWTPAKRRLGRTTSRLEKRRTSHDRVETVHEHCHVNVAKVTEILKGITWNGTLKRLNFLKELSSDFPIGWPNTTQRPYRFNKMVLSGRRGNSEA